MSKKTKIAIARAQLELVNCAKPVLERFRGAKYRGGCEEYPNCTPIWA